MRNNYVFTKDDNSITLYKKVKVKDKNSKNYGQDIDKLIGHYSSVEQVVRKLVHLELIESGSVQELIADLRQVSANVKELVKVLV